MDNDTQKTAPDTFEELCEQNAIARTSLFVLVLVFAVAVIMAGRALVAAGVPWADMLSFIALIAFAYYLLNRYLTAYRYTFEDGSLYVERVSGRKNALLCGIAVADSPYFGPYKNAYPEKAQVCRATPRALGSAWALDFVLEGKAKRQRLVFSPSPELIEKIKSCREAARPEAAETAVKTEDD